MKKRSLEGSKRAVTEKDQLLPHVPSRHQARDEELYHPTGEKFGQGTLFPPHVKAGHITQMERFAQEQWHLYLQKQKAPWQKSKRIKRKRCHVHSLRERARGYKVVIRVNKFGIKFIEAFFTKDNVLRTIYPIENSKGAPLTDRGIKTRKSDRKTLRRLRNKK